MKDPIPSSRAFFFAGAVLLGIIALNLICLSSGRQYEGPHGVQTTTLIMFGIDCLALLAIYGFLKNRYLLPMQKYVSQCDELLRAVSGLKTSTAGVPQTIAELTESLLADRAGLRSRESLLIDNAVDVICVIDFQGKFLTVNPSVEPSWGYRKDELIGHQLSEFISKEEAAELENILASPLSIKRIAFDNQLCHKDGHPIDFSWSAHWSVSDGGLFCVARDISDRKRAERLQREFTAMVNHDLSAPLSSVTGLISLLADGAFGELNEDGKKRCILAENELARLMRLINDLLDVERIQSGKLKLVCDLVSVQDIIEESAFSVQTFAELRKIVVQFDETELPCFADRKRIIQVMVNLLSNAIKFSPANSKVTISTERLDQKIKISVLDQGTGIPPDKAANLFKRFQQVHDETDSAREGFGLGLSICKLIIDAHGGEIGCASDNMQAGGSVFWFTLATSA